MPKRSAGILLFRRRPAGLEVFLAHPGGPFWASKDHGAWTIPKGEIEEDEDPLTAAQREFREETGVSAEGAFLDLGEIRQKSGKRVAAWAAEGDADPATCESITFSMEWPPRSGKTADFSEVDRWEWFDLAEAARRIHPAQLMFIERLRARLD